MASSSSSKKKSAGSRSATVGKATPARKVRSSKGGRKSVTVKKGDTLSAIARRNGESLGQLRKDNPGLFSKAHRGGNLIFPGNKVKLRAAPKKRSSTTTRRKTNVTRAPKRK
jgi:LysM repeat protein